MLSALIVDDEQNVCHLIRNLVDWDALGIDVIGMANDGHTAYNMILEYEPDIVITDIRMPAFDGLELIKNVQQIGLSPRFILISGYKHFEYARQAIKYGVEEYLLKPLKRETLTAALEKAKSKIGSDPQKSKLFFIGDAIINPTKSRDVIMRDIRANHGYSQELGWANVIYLKLDTNNRSQREVIPGLLEKVTKMARAVFKDVCENASSYFMYSGVILVLDYGNIDPSTLEGLRDKYTELVERVEAYLGLFGDIFLTLGVSPVTDYDGLVHSVEIVIEAVIARIILGAGQIIFADNLSYRNLNPHRIWNMKRRNALENAFATLNRVAIKQSLSDIFADFSALRDANPRLLIEFTRDALNQFIQVMKRFGIEGSNERELRELVGLEVDYCLSVDELYTCVLKAMDREIVVVLNKRHNEDNKPIRDAKAYVQAHYMEKITLQDVANHVHLNPDYLSTTFKREVGINFSEYLILYRLERAKELLLNTHLTVDEVAENVGYGDRRYFSNLFRDRVGVKPSEYRRLYS